MRDGDPKARYMPAMGVTRNPDFNPCLRERGFEAERDEVLDMMEIEDSE